MFPLRYWSQYALPPLEATLAAEKARQEYNSTALPSRPVQPYGSEGYVNPGGADNNCDCGDENCVN